jgi:uncharacterized protein YlxW (UPF0749 family)
MFDKVSTYLSIFLIISGIILYLFYKDKRKREEEYQQALKEIRLLQEKNKLMFKLRQYDQEIQMLQDSINADTAVVNEYRRKLAELRAKYGIKTGDSTKRNQKP